MHTFPLWDDCPCLAREHAEKGLHFFGRLAHGFEFWQELKVKEAFHLIAGKDVSPRHFSVRKICNNAYRKPHCSRIVSVMAGTACGNIMKHCGNRCTAVEIVSALHELAP